MRTLFGATTGAFFRHSGCDPLGSGCQSLRGVAWHRPDLSHCTSKVDHIGGMSPQPALSKDNGVEIAPIIVGCGAPDRDIPCGFPKDYGYPPIVQTVILDALL